MSSSQRQHQHTNTQPVPQQPGGDSSAPRVSSFVATMRNLPAVPGLYVVNCTASGKFYLGESKNVQRRVRHHLSQLRHNKHHSQPLQRAFDKYGEDAFEVRLLKIEPNEARRKQAEVAFYHRWKPAYNATIPNGKPGGELTSERRAKRGDAIRQAMANPETRQRISNSVRRAWADPELRQRQSNTVRRALKDPEVNKRIREETRRALAQPETKRRHCEGTKQAFSNPETKQRHREAVRYTWANPEVHRRRCNGIRQACASPEARKGMSEHSTQMWKNPEHRQKVAEAHRARFDARDAKKYATRIADGTVFHVANYTRFAREHGLKAGAIFPVLNEKPHHKTHRGFRISTAEEIAQYLAEHENDSKSN